MDIATLQALKKLNDDFYQGHCESFSQSRGSAWPGWERVARHLKAGRLLDVACGNLRFERFLVEHASPVAFDFTCIDSCPSLARARGGISFVERDVLDGLIAGIPLPDGYDSAVSFGFMHHVPTMRLRVEFMRQMLASVRPGGAVALSFWQFARDGRMAEKARRTTERGMRELGLELDALDEGDYLLGWNDIEGVYRYCHSFTDDELVGLVRSCAGAAELVDRFRADGRTGELNGYVVLRRL